MDWISEAVNEPLQFNVSLIRVAIVISSLYSSENYNWGNLQNFREMLLQIRILHIANVREVGGSSKYMFNHVSSSGKIQV